MSDTMKKRSPRVRLALVLAALALAAVLASCAAPAQPPAAAPAQPPAAAPAATQPPAPTEAPAVPTAAAADPATAAEPAAAPAPTATPAAAPTEAPAAVPTDAPSAPAAAAVSFSNDIMPVFEKSCIKCHGGEDGTKGDLDLRTHDAVMKGGKDGQVVVPGDSANSMLWKLVDNGKMPRRQPKLPQEQIDLVARWIAEGAQNN